MFRVKNKKWCNGDHDGSEIRPIQLSPRLQKERRERQCSIHIISIKALFDIKFIIRGTLSLSIPRVMKVFSNIVYIYIYTGNSIYTVYIYYVYINVIIYSGVSEQKVC